MNMEIYDGMYINIERVAQMGCTFNLIIGARGIGKTYGVVKMTTSMERNVLFLRRLQNQIDNTVNDVSTPWTKYVTDAELGRTCVLKPSKNIRAVYTYKELDEKEKPIPDKLLGLCTSVSTFASIRGVDFSTIDTIVLDEFIPEKRERPIRNEMDAFFNLYESVSRNRELEGKESVKVFMLSNSNDFLNPYLVGLNVVRDIEKLYTSDNEEYVDRERSLYIYMPKKVPVSEKKRKTALYRLAGEGEFSEMALDNKFHLSELNVKRNVPLREYRALFGIGEIYVYKHKSSLYTYVCATRHNTDYYTLSENDMARCNAKYSALITMMLITDKYVLYDSLTSKSLFKYYFT